MTDYATVDVVAAPASNTVAGEGDSRMAGARNLAGDENIYFQGNCTEREHEENTALTAENSTHSTKPRHGNSIDAKYRCPFGFKPVY